MGSAVTTQDWIVDHDSAGKIGEFFGGAVPRYDARGFDGQAMLSPQWLESQDALTSWVAIVVLSLPY